MRLIRKSDFLNTIDIDYNGVEYKRQVVACQVDFDRQNILDTQVNVSYSANKKKASSYQFNIILIKADELGLKPIFTIVDYAEVSQPTKDIATVPGLAIKKILEQNDMTLDQMDVIEINEAFAAAADTASAASAQGMRKAIQCSSWLKNKRLPSYGRLPLLAEPVPRRRLCRN